MGSIDWKKVLAFVLREIANGLSKDEAVSKGAAKFGVSKSGIMGKL